MKIDRELVVKLAHESGLADPHLSSDQVVNCDYGDCTEALLRFVDLITQKIMEANNVR